MEHYGSDFNATGSVMSRAELEEQRRKRGECVRCGQKCFQKKLFKMIPITEHGKVENGRCLNCHPLDVSSGTIPAVSRPATQADLKRFSKTQTSLRKSNVAVPGRGTPNGGLEHHRGMSQPVFTNTDPNTPPPNPRNLRRSGQSPGGSSGMQSMRNVATTGGSRRSIRSSDYSAHSSSSDPYHRGDRSNDGDASVMSIASSNRGAIGVHTTGRSADSVHSLETSPRDSRGTDSRILPPSGAQRPGQLRPNSTRHISSPSYHSENSGYPIQRRYNDDSSDDGDEYVRAHRRDGNHDGAAEFGRRYEQGKDYRREGIERSPSRHDRAANLDYYQRPSHDINRSMHSDESRHGADSDGFEDNKIRVGSGSNHLVKGSLSSNHDSLGGSTHSSYHVRSSYQQSDIIPSNSTRAYRSIDSEINNGKFDVRRQVQRKHSMDHDRSTHRKNSMDHSVQSFEDESRPRYGRQPSFDRDFVPINEFGFEKSTDSNWRTPSEIEDNALCSASDTDVLQRLRETSDDYVEILNILRNYNNLPVVQTLGMQLLSNLQLTEDDCNALANLGAVQIIVEAMMSYRDLIEVQISGCRAMWNASFTNLNQVAFVECGALDILLECMAKFVHEPDLQEQAISVLANIGAAEQNLNNIFEKGAVTQLVASMNKHINRAIIQIRGCLAIANLASHHSSLKHKILESGAGSAIVISMVMHPINAELQEKALRALRNLSANCDQNRIEITNIGGIDAIVSAMQVHRDSAEVQEAGAWTLSNLAGNPDSRMLIGDCGGIDVTVRAMWVHTERVTVQEWCCRALFTLSLEPNNNAMIINVGGISVIVNAMQAHNDSPAIQEMGCAVLYNLASDQQSKMRIVDEEALDAVVLAMVLHCDDDRVQERACQLLLRLSILENFKAMQASNVGELVRAAAFKFPDGCGEPADKLMKVIDSFLVQYQLESTG